MKPTTDDRPLAGLSITRTFRTPPREPPPVATLTEALARAVSDEPWIAFHLGAEVRTLTWRGAADLGRRWASAFAAVGVAPDDRVAIIQPNDEGFVGAYLGALQCGAIPVPLAWPLMPTSLARSLQVIAPLVAKADPRAIATPARFAEAYAFGIPTVSGPAAIPLAHEAEAQPERAAFIQFTSGTTGAPRGAMISHRAAIASAWAMGQALGLGPKDVGAAWLPLFHDMGLVGVLLCSLLWRFPIHVMTPAEFLLHPDRWLRMISAARATLTAAPNFGYELVTRRLRHQDGLDLSSLRYALNGAEPVHRGTIDDFERALAASGLVRGTVLPVYGLAENTLGVCFSQGSAHDLPFEGRTVPSVGRPLPGMEVGILDSGDGDAGEIVVRSPSLMSGYFRDPEATGVALVDGWLRTGDLGVVKDGQLYVTGREKDLVIKGGRKFHPYDIERVVANTVDAPPNGVVAFSVANAALRNEELVVVVERRRQDGGDVERAIRGRLLEELGIRAERIRFVAFGALPRTTSGKVRRRACAELFGGAESGA